MELKKHTQAAQKHWGDYVQHVKIEADTTEIDEAIRKVEKLVEVIEKANQLVDTLFKRLEA